LKINLISSNFNSSDKLQKSSRLCTNYKDIIENDHHKNTEHVATEACVEVI